MIPVASNITQYDNLPGDETAFTIGDARWVMRSMADLYSNRELAVIREYSTNARDSHIENGNPERPIEVHLPSMLNPTFTVRDYGVGMDEQTLKDIYTKFGTSTKQSSNDFNGMLGFGCKSAIAYTETFTVTSYKNGRKIIAVVTRKPDYSIVLKVVATTHTNEENGVEIQVPVHNAQEFAHKAQDFYKFWLPGTVLVDGKEPVQEVGDKLTEGLYYSTHWSTSYVVMGNVPYRIANPDALFRNSRMRNIAFVAYVDNGDVEFTPSREDLKYTEHTKAALAKVITDFEDKIISQAKADIAAATTHAEAYQAWNKWTKELGTSLFSELEFNGDKFVDSFKINAMRYDTSGYGYSTYRISQWGVGDMHNTMIVTDFGINLASKHKAQAKEYASLMGWSRPKFVLFTDADKVESPWITQDRVVKWDDLKDALPKKPKKPRAVASGPGRIPGSFDYWTRNGREFEKALPAKGEVFYIMVQRDKSVSVKSALQLMESDAAVIILPANRFKKFTRENPTVKEFTEYVKSQVVIEGKTLICDKAKAALEVSSTMRQWVKHLDVSKIDDPAFAAVKDIVKDEAKYMKRYNDNLALASTVGMRYNVKEHNISPVSSMEPNVRYPLVRDIGYYGNVHKHTYIYMNAVFAAEKGTK